MTVNERMLEIRRHVILVIYLSKHDLLILMGNQDTIEAEAIKHYHTDTNFNNYCEMMCCLIYNTIKDCQ